MKENKGITMVALVITIIVLIIIASISIGEGNKVIQRSNLESLKTNMLLIKGKAQEYVESANFNLGTSFETLSETDKNTRISKAKENLVGTEITNSNEFSSSIGSTAADNTNLIYYYKLSTNDVNELGLSNVKSDTENGIYVIRYDLKNAEVEIYNSLGFTGKSSTAYSLTDLQNLEI